MKRRECLGVIGGAAAAWPLMAFAQQPVTPVIGFLGVTSPEAFGPRLSAFRKGLAAGGFVEYQNVRIEYRWANDVASRLPELAADLVGRNVNVIATGGGSAPALAAKAATSTIPIIFATPGSDPIELGLVTSMNRPTGNITGVGFLVSTISAKQIEVMSEAVPNASVIGLLVNPHNPASSYYIKNVQEAADVLGRKVLVLRAATEIELAKALATLTDQRVGAFIAIPDVFFFRRKEQLVGWASRNSIPGMYGSRDFPEAGGLMSYGTSIDDGYRQEGLYYTWRASSKASDRPICPSSKL